MLGVADGDDEPKRASGRELWSKDDWQRFAEKRLPEQRYVGPDFDELVGSNVTRFRKARGLSQADLAAAISDEGNLVHQQTIQKIEKGTRPLKYTEAIHISNVLGISPSDLADSPTRAESNGHFIRGISGVTSAQKALDTAAEQLIRALVQLGGILSFHKDGAENYQPDAHLIEYAQRLVSADWGEVFLHKMRNVLDDPMAASIPNPDDIPPPDVYRQVVHDLRAQTAPGNSSEADRNATEA